MMTSWTAWKPFPNPQIGGHVEAPIGPGVYEVRNTMSGEAVAFGHSGNVAHALTSLVPSGPLAILARRRLKPDELEYRTCAASTAGEAKTMAERLRGRREVFWRRRMAAGWA
jgi:hypothetical protein